MCGICGFTGAVEADLPILKAMCDVMAHRGPDGEGQYTDDGIALGHRRLSLIDLDVYKRQPVDCEARGIADGDYIRMFNDRGTCTLRVRFNNGIRPGMVVIDHGWDLDQFVDGFYCDLLGYNVTPVVANSYYFDTLIEIEKATV